MKSIELLGFFVKVLSICLFVKGVGSAAGFYVYVIEGLSAPDSMGKTFQIMTLGSYVMMIFAAILMWSFPISIAKWFMPKSDDQRFPDIELKLQGLELVSFTVIGIYILSWAIPDLVHNFAILKQMGGNSLYSEKSVNEIKIATFVTVIEIGIGVLLCVFSGNVSKLLAALRK